MYKLLNKLFGWDYIYWQNSASQGIARVHTSLDGTVFYWRYKSIKLADILYNPNTNYLELYPAKIIWLTCKQEKYYAY